MEVFDRLAACVGFEWDESNLLENWERHRVSSAECEQLFFNRPLIAEPDVDHSDREPRFYVLGQTDAGRRLFIVFTLRGERIRVISARDLSRKERQEYERHG